MHATAPPLWAIALAAAVFAPFVARALATAFEGRVRERTERALAHVGSNASRARRT
jgi:hypothetical protein